MLKYKQNQYDERTDYFWLKCRLGQYGFSRIGSAKAAFKLKGG